MKATVLTVLSLVLFGAVTAFSMNTLNNDSVPSGSSSVECVVYTDQEGLVTFRMEKTPGEVVKVRLYNEKGNLMASRRFKKLTNIKLRYDLSECPEGIYTIKVKSGDNVVYSHPVSYPERSLAGK